MSIQESENGMPRITFGIIVLNGEPFVRYNLRALYPFAHEIIIVEGAVPAAASIATSSGHSTDGTLETLYRFKSEEDPENKIQIVTRDGFWSEKDEQSQAYARRVTGDYLWQVDIDEFYKPEDMQAIIDMLRRDPEISAASFKMRTFWGGFNYVTDGFYLRRGQEIYHRLFKWGPGYRYVTHRPPTAVDDAGRNLRTLKWINGDKLERQGIVLYHYSLLFPKQVREKCSYYSRVSWSTVSRDAQRWAEENYMRLEHPFRVHNVYFLPSWLERFYGNHPPTIRLLESDIVSGCVQIDLRPTEDIEQVLASRCYAMGRFLLKCLAPLYAWAWHLRVTVGSIGKQLLSALGVPPFSYAERNHGR
jgi:hypothetical protein